MPKEEPNHAPIAYFILLTKFPGLNIQKEPILEPSGSTDIRQDGDSHKERSKQPLHIELVGCSYNISSPSDLLEDLIVLLEGLRAELGGVDGLDELVHGGHGDVAYQHHQGWRPTKKFSSPGKEENKEKSFWNGFPLFSGGLLINDSHEGGKGKEKEEEGFVLDAHTRLRGEVEEGISRMLG